MQRWVLASFCLIWFSGCPNSEKPGADLLIHNARVYTVDDSLPWADAVAIQGDRISWVGAEAEAEAYRGERTRVIDANGQFLLPGFIDSHNHIRYGNEPDSVDLSDAGNLSAIRERIRDFAEAHPKSEWIQGGGWRYESLPGDGLPRAEYLTGLTGGRPAFFVSYDAHTAWLNPEAMMAIGLTAGSDLAKRDEVVLDLETGEPTGVVKGVVSLGSANQVLNRLYAQLPDDDRLYRSLQQSLLQALGYGITTIVAPQTGVDEVSAFARARDEGILKSRVQTALFHPVGMEASDLVLFSSAAERFDDDQLRVTAIKLYIDDVIEAHTAAMLEPYADQGGEQGEQSEQGELFYSPEDFKALVARLDAANYQLFVHAIGDRGVRVALDAFEHARRVNGKRDSRHQLVHVELVSPPDLSRFAELGVIACMQPRHILPEGNGQWADAVGPTRLPYAFPWRSLGQAGAKVVFSSDWDVSEMDPLVGIYSAVTRQSLLGEPRGGWVPEQRVDLATAIRAYTLDGAYANFAEGNRGSVTPGKYADLVLLSDNLFEIPPSKILEAKVELTLVGGEIVYRRPPKSSLQD